MPQMSPIKWLILFTLFSFTFIIFNMMNYYFYFYSFKKNNFIINKMNKKMIWKW